ncbi:copper resistance protein CopC [Actinacidiphila glaucinigra]|uniref:copper resistance CopC family protein n=1 Tax=Actinacidiphila glaucinigra TaxID=235986 RepID=UPI00372194D4
MTFLAPPARRAVWRFATVLGLIILAVVVGTAAPASALLFTSPAADATVADSPKALLLVFDQPVALTGSTVRLLPAATFGAATLSEDGRTVTVPLRGHMATGVRTVDWQVTARDGDVMNGSYQFAVGPRTVALHSGQATAAKGASATAVLRWLMFAALAMLLGELTSRRLAAGAGLRRWAPATALAGGRRRHWPWPLCWPVTAPSSATGLAS